MAIDRTFMDRVEKRRERARIKAEKLANYIATSLDQHIPIQNSPRALEIETIDVNIKTAAEIGLQSTYLVGLIDYICMVNAQANKCFFDGFYWAYLPANDACQLLKGTLGKANNVLRLLGELEKKGVFVSGSFGKGYDRTKCYRVNHDKLQELVGA